MGGCCTTVQPEEVALLNMEVQQSFNSDITNPTLCSSYEKQKLLVYGYIHANVLSEYHDFIPNYLFELTCRFFVFVYDRKFWRKKSLQIQRLLSDGGNNGNNWGIDELAGHLYLMDKGASLFWTKNIAGNVITTEKDIFQILYSLTMVVLKKKQINFAPSQRMLQQLSSEVYKMLPVVDGEPQLTKQMFVNEFHNVLIEIYDQRELKKYKEIANEEF